jgi:hypothetical protein
MGAISISGGDKLKAKLFEIAAKVSRGGTLSVGFLGNATEANGTSTALVAAINEFGGTIPARQVDEHVISIYNKIQKDGTFANEGKFVKKSKSNFERQVVVPAHVIPAHKIPPRPFFRRMISLGKDHWGDDLGKIMLATGYDGKLALRQLGTMMAGELQQSIIDQVYAPNAKSTVEKKGFSTTLIDTGDMLRSVDFNVSD